MLGLWKSVSALALDEYAPNNAALLISDVRIVAEQTPTTLRFQRPIVEGNGFRHAAPCARVTFQTDAQQVRLNLYWNGLITRLDTFRSIGSVLVDGVEIGQFSSTFSASGTGLSQPTFNLPSGSKVVTVVWPYAAGLELRGIGLNNGASISAPPARPTDIIAACGDSITHGFSVGRTAETWAFNLAIAKSAQIYNLANGSEQANPANATTALTGTGAQTVTYLIGYNNFVAQTPISSFQASVEGWIANARAALPEAEIYVISPIYSPNSNTIPLSDYRSAVQAAEAAAGDAATTFVDGLSIMANNTSRLADGVHPNATGASEIVASLASII